MSKVFEKSKSTASLQSKSNELWLTKVKKANKLKLQFNSSVRDDKK